jgi:predicted glycoside hydrolase/deacetylase ChbG (UPF0249 family)
MLIINADDWGGWTKATDSALACHAKSRITSVTAMVFMEDSERAATLARASGMDVGLHLNLNQHFDGSVSRAAADCHERIVRFLSTHKYAQLLYNPFLGKCFRDDFAAQMEEFRRLYGNSPTHIDGHQHMHLCSNMLMGHVIPGGEKVRRNFSFWPGEKGGLNRAYRRMVDRRLARRHRITDYFFSLEQCLKENRLGRVAGLSRTANVELMTHPEKAPEYDWLMSEDYLKWSQGLQVRPYATL